MTRDFYLTTPIYYVNARPHLGHAYTTIIADAMARYRRLAGDDVFFLTGTDEHGDKIAQAAAAAGVSPQAYADEISAAFREAWRQLGIRNDDYIRTTEARHKVVVQRILQTLWDAGEVYFGKYGGQYCFGCERFYTDKEIVDGKCPDHQTPLTFIEEENYFFRMSKYQDWLVRYIGEHPDMIRPERYRNEILGFLREPLQDLSISRPRTRLEWGIPLPFDDRFVTYVWFDALINYVSAIGYPDGPHFERRWRVAQHLIGKDILKPHGVYWPTMLAALAAATGKPREALIYRHLNVHGYWTVDGQKMSKSLGNFVEPLPMQDKYGEAFRYFLLREAVFGLDSDFSERALVARLNADLANDLGNFVSRATTLLAGASPAEVPQPLATPSPPDELVRTSAESTRVIVEQAMSEFALQRALAQIGEFIAVLNRYVDTTQPWALAKDPQKVGEFNRVLVTLADALTFLGIVLEPFIPDAATKIRRAVGDTRVPIAANALVGRSNRIPRVEKLSGLFPRIDEKKAGAAAATERTAAKTDASPRIVADDFAKIDLRVAEVVAAEPVPKSKKLLKLTVSLGAEQRTVVAGIAEHYAPGDLVGKKVVIVANLEPAKLMGVESNGMVLAGSADGGLAVLTLDRDLPPGSKVK